MEISKRLTQPEASNSLYFPHLKVFGKVKNRLHFVAIPLEL